MRQLRVALAGLGSRGKDTYAKTAKLFPEKMKITAIADIDPDKVAEVAREYGVPAEHCFSSAEELLAQEKLADVMFITTQDRQHVGHAIPALKKGYDLLLEKPVSPDLQECRDLLKTAQECGRKVVVCHVLRYTPFYTKLKEILDAGRIGETVTVMGIENVGYWHQAHSFVRGNWRNSDTTSPMILQKCCHDMDLLLWLTGKTAESVTSYGSTYLFKEEMAPEGAALRCMDGCAAKAECPFDAEKIYLTNEKTGVEHGHTGWPCNVLTLHPTPESVREAIQKGPYGRCVYHCDNNVVDHQVVNICMTDGSTISFTMSGFTEKNSRYTKFMGTKGEITADLHENTIEVQEFGKAPEIIDVSKLSDDFSGHAGGDNRMVEEFLDMLIEGKEPEKSMTTLERSLESHYIALAAERSRLEGGRVVKMSEMRERNCV
ncbi:MAG TPA: Gfo/Idh/MocA family oxidoreductase [Candidatus Fusicatenibacter intestinigallinarum]|uniref:Gfo/Idh/MocA family oxidoreductase n=1 Tax=Candidatus Fusicatenibacter intestinigallinarum TaxID=2838598 RepID=A0A9D2SNH7_9FIRM|nr:Gfo/Idh/MocA family oxidoreductase [Candidatus Fusicatenibacter intestinigallinarum]